MIGLIFEICESVGEAVTGAVESIINTLGNLQKKILVKTANKILLHYDIPADVDYNKSITVFGRKMFIVSITCEIGPSGVESGKFEFLEEKNFKNSEIRKKV